MYVFRRETINRLVYYLLRENITRDVVPVFVLLGVEQLMEILEIWRQLEAVW